MLTLPLPELKAKIIEQTGLSSQDLDKKIQEKMDHLSGLISEEGACHIIANELSVQLIPSADERKIKDLLPGMRDVQQDMRVVQVYELRTFQTKAGSEGKVCSFLGGDESGVVRVAGWGARAEEVSKLETGSIVRVTHGYVRENNGRSELHINDKSELVLNPEGVTIGETTQTTENTSYVRKKINELSKGDYRVELLGTIVQVYDPRFFTRKDGNEGVVSNILIDDGTGNIRCACWDEKAAKLLGMTQEELLGQKEASLEKEKTEALGLIVKLTGRVKLNTMYNSLELTVDELDLEPNPENELSQATLGSDEPVKTEEPLVEKTAPEAVSEPVKEKVESVDVTTETVAVEDPVEEALETPSVSGPASKPKENLFAEETKSADGLPSLDDLDDLDLDDL